MNFKKIVKKIINIFGYEIKKKDLEIEELSFDQILKKKLIKKKPIIFDVGANNGQSIERFLNLFQGAKIHSFEPLQNEFENLKKKI